MILTHSLCSHRPGFNTCYATCNASWTVSTWHFHIYQGGTVISERTKEGGGGLFVNKQYLLLSLPILCIKLITYKGIFFAPKINVYLTSTHIHKHL